MKKLWDLVWLRMIIVMAVGFTGGFALSYYYYPQVQVINGEDSIVMMEEKTFTTIQDDIASIKENFDELVKALAVNKQKSNNSPKVKIN